MLSPRKSLDYLGMSPELELEADHENRIMKKCPSSLTYSENSKDEMKGKYKFETNNSDPTLLAKDTFM